MSDLRCSVVIPSHNRCGLLAQGLEALARQTLPREAFEVIVVLDGCTDGSDALLQRWRAEGRLPHLQWIVQAQSGQAAARTAGAAAARSPILVFLDDDILPRPGLLEAHLRRYQDGGAAVAVLGPAPIPRKERPTFYETALWAWWEDVYHQRSQPDRLSSYKDFCAGNVSLRREDFVRVGGFDAAFRGYGGEDYDLGYRLVQAGVAFVTAPEAQADHQHASTAAVMLRHMRQEGRHDVLLGRKHPALRRGLRLMTHPQGAWLVFAAPRLVDGLQPVFEGLLRGYERLRWRGRWLKLFGRLRHLAYWRGVVDGLGNWAAYRAFCESAPPPPRCTLDLTQGLPPRLSGVWSHGPCDVQVTAGGRALGTVRLIPPPLGLSRRDVADELVRRLEPGLWASLAEQGWQPPLGGGASAPERGSP